MKICCFGIYKREYPRNNILMSGLEMNNAELIECNANWNEKGRYLKLFKKLRGLGNNYDLIYCGYPATVPTILAKIISRKPVVMDAFYSMFDAVVWDRKEIKWYHPRALKLLFLDWVSVIMADYILTDTEAHKIYWSKWPFVNSKKIFTVYIGTDNRIFFPKESVDKDLEHFWVSFHGMFIPLHGLEKIIESANILKNDDSIRFRLIGSGAESKKIKKLIELYDLKNIEQIERITPEELNEYLNKADIILGIFGDTKKAWRVIANKVYEGMAVKKPVINMDSPVIREVFNPHELMLIENTPKALAEAILCLKNNPSLSGELVKNAYEKMTTNYFPKPIGKNLLVLFSKFIKKTQNS